MSKFDILDDKCWGVELVSALKELEKVINLGGKKYGYSSFLDKDNPSIQHRANSASMFRHLAHHHVSCHAKDDESDTYHISHLACRSLMKLARLVKKID